jgi:hypothetical protein
MNPSALLSFILAFASSSLLVSPVKADLYQLVLHSNSEAALDAAAADSSAILQDWIDDEPSSVALVAIAPGKAVPADEGGGARERNLQISTCPGSCWNSGSTYCRSLGCAYCGRSCARRNLRRSFGSGGQSPGQAEAKLNAALAPYCTGAGPDCEIYVKIVKV